VIIAAAVVDDVMALVLLAQLNALEDEDARSTDYMMPAATSLAFLFLLGPFLVYSWPHRVNR
jgi:Kef-type K+ transport system membrane component KefB